MDTYKEQFQELQEYAFNILREYPLDKTAVNVLSALVNSKKERSHRVF
ncbi:gp47 [Streptococcus phage SFi18]|nr:gp47 [Streptococcus phage SFi18]